MNKANFITFLNEQLANGFDEITVNIVSVENENDSVCAFVKHMTINDSNVIIYGSHGSSLSLINEIDFTDNTATEIVNGLDFFDNPKFELI